jgi:hypothetical protein
LTPKRSLLTLTSGAIMIVLAFTPILVCFTWLIVMIKSKLSQSRIRNTHHFKASCTCRKRIESITTTKAMATNTICRGLIYQSISETNLWGLSLKFGIITLFFWLKKLWIVKITIVMGSPMTANTTLTIHTSKVMTTTITREFGTTRTQIKAFSIKSLAFLTGLKTAIRWIWMN